MSSAFWRYRDLVIYDKCDYCGQRDPAAESVRVDGIDYTFCQGCAILARNNAFGRCQVCARIGLDLGGVCAGCSNPLRQPKSGNSRSQMLRRISRVERDLDQSEPTEMEKARLERSADRAAQELLAMKEELERQ